MNRHGSIFDEISIHVYCSFVMPASGVLAHRHMFRIGHCFAAVAGCKLEFTVSLKFRIMLTF
jgi:hypothetical protein